MEHVRFFFSNIVDCRVHVNNVFSEWFAGTLTIDIQTFVQTAELQGASGYLDHSDPIVFLDFVDIENLASSISYSKIYKNILF